MCGKSMVPRWCRADWRFGSSFPARWRNLKRMSSGAVGSAVRVHHSQGHWIPAFAGMTTSRLSQAGREQARQGYARPPTYSFHGSAGSPSTMKSPLSTVSRWRSEEHTSELQSLMRISYAVFCLKKKIKHQVNDTKQSHK